eukprot:13946543-Alexandrium_andersonii.AAC.1
MAVAACDTSVRCPVSSIMGRPTGDANDCPRVRRMGMVEAYATMSATGSLQGVGLASPNTLRA